MVFVCGLRFIWCTCSTVFSVKPLHTKQHAVAFKTCCFAATATAAACGIHCIYVVCLIMLAMSMNFLSFALTRTYVCVLVCVNAFVLAVFGLLRDLMAMFALCFALVTSSKYNTQRPV